MKWSKKTATSDGFCFDTLALILSSIFSNSGYRPSKNSNKSHVPDEHVQA